MISENHITQTLLQSDSHLIECDMSSIIYADSDFTIIRHDEKCYIDDIVKLNLGRTKYE